MLIMYIFAFILIGSLSLFICCNKGQCNNYLERGGGGGLEN